MFLIFLILSVFFSPSSAEEHEKISKAHYELVSEKLEPGHYLSIHGRFSEDIDRASVNLLKGGREVEHNDVVLHVNFRFDEKQTVYNQKWNNTWADTQQIGNLPYQPGQEFRMKILIDESGFNIFLNENSTVYLKRQLHVDSTFPIHADHLQILGVIDLYEAKWFQTNATPFIIEYDVALRIGMTEVLELLPHGTFIIGLLKSDEEIFFRVKVNFPGGEMAATTSVFSVVGLIDKIKSTQFVVGEIATLSIRNDEGALTLYVNGLKTLVFKHHAEYPDDDYKTLAIFGAVDVLAEQHS